MTELLHTDLADHLKKEPIGSLPAVFLLHGQEMLVEQAAELLIAKLLDGASRDLYCEVVEGLVERTTEVLARLNTYSLLAGPKIVLFKEARLFESRSSHQRLADQIIEAYQNEELHQAAKSLINLCGQMQTGLEELLESPSGREPVDKLVEHCGSDGLQRLAQYCREQGWHPAGAGDHAEALQQAIEKGFAEHHYLIITAAAKVPKNLRLYKSIRDHGWIVDCSVPLGERRADRMAQESVLRQTLQGSLAAAGKRLQAGLFDILCQLTGFDLRTFAQNVEKLIDYTGERKDITAEDVHGVLRRTKSDPIFELTNAVADRNLEQSLFYLHTLLAGSWFPLQILAAVSNQIRRLLVAKDFTLSAQGRCWARGMSYPQFQHGVMPAIEEFDKQVRQAAAAWQSSATAEDKEKTVTSRGGSDVALAPNAGNPYPVYQTLLKSEKYTKQELIRAMTLLNQADLRLKSTGQDTAIVLKQTIMNICAPPGR